MVDSDKLNHKTSQLTGKAAKLGGQARDKATHVAGEVISRATPLAGQARDKATELARRAAPIAAHGVESTATRLDRLTHGKYSQQIKSVSAKLEQVLDHDGQRHADTPSATDAPSRTATDGTQRATDGRPSATDAQSGTPTDTPPTER